MSGEENAPLKRLIGMKPEKTIVAAAVAGGVLLVVGAVGWMGLRRSDEPVARVTATPGAVQPRSVMTAPKPAIQKPSANEVGTTQKSSTVARSGKKVRLDPEARKALKHVGSDADAERYWIEAINNPFLPAEERQDLIEDLNEDGLSDPKNPNLGDLQLINSRLRLIEELMPKAMDRVNAEAFQEAHKDLAKMQAKLAGR